LNTLSQTFFQHVVWTSSVGEYYREHVMPG